ncbi:RNA recognition domain-containing protein [Colletotrichum melonis]|uniref:RNA recognition domain-containing protein n=2 Tax=Colletotrichum acutatum species complex TaxID=2707335 RepID=A0AAI9V4N9_9PEZI|nr:RNA recognition domain-containing protein [Colletotrichum melonis]
MATTDSEKRSKKTKAKAEPEAEVEVEDAPSQSPESSKKRKSTAAVEEIEVDLEAPEPPSKRAKRALKKGKKLPVKLDSDDEREAKKKEEKEQAKAAARSEHGVWIGNLPFFVTPDELRQWLIDNSGEMITKESITRLHMPTTKQVGKDKPSNKGFAYVDFNDVAPKVAAIALTEAELSRRKLLIKDSKSFEGRPKKEEETAAAGGAAGAAAAKEEVPKSSKIFIGNLSFKTTDDDVWQHFEKCGQIDWVKVATFEDTGKCKGYGWVKFREPEAAGWAVKGFVKIKEEIETEDDFVASKDKDGDDEMAEGEEDKKTEEKKFKLRKWWVNKLLGRMLKIELAEDDQTRYKKRFGKDAPKRQEQKSRRDGEEGGEGAEEATEERKPRAPRPPKTEKPAGELKAQVDLMVARLTAQLDDLYAMDIESLVDRLARRNAFLIRLVRWYRRLHPTRPHGFTINAFIVDEVTQPVPAPYFPILLGSWRLMACLIFCNSIVVYSFIFYSVWSSPSLVITSVLVVQIIAFIFRTLGLGSGTFTIGSLLSSVGHYYAISCLVFVSKVSLFWPSIWSYFWFIYCLFAIRRRRFSQNYHEAWKLKYPGHFIPVFIGRSDCVRIPLPGPDEPGMDDLQMWKHLSFFYRLYRIEGGFSQVLLPKALIRFEIVEITDDIYKGPLVSGFDVPQRILRLVENETPTSVPAGHDPRRDIRELRRASVYRDLVQADSLKGLRFVVGWDTTLISVVVLLPTIVSIATVVAWPIVAVLKYEADVQTSVQTGATVGSYIVTAGALLIGLVTLFDALAK